jgi:hypothetical protein
VTKGGLVKIIGGTLEEMSLKRSASAGVDGDDEDMRKRKDKESGIERETHCLEERRVWSVKEGTRYRRINVFAECGCRGPKAQPWALVKCEGMKRREREGIENGGEYTGIGSQGRQAV